MATSVPPIVNNALTVCLRPGVAGHAHLHTAGDDELVLYASDCKFVTIAGTIRIHPDGSQSSTPLGLFVIHTQKIHRACLSALGSSRCNYIIFEVYSPALSATLCLD